MIKAGAVTAFGDLGKKQGYGIVDEITQYLSDNEAKG